MSEVLRSPLADITSQTNAEVRKKKGKLKKRVRKQSAKKLVPQLDFSFAGLLSSSEEEDSGKPVAKWQELVRFSSVESLLSDDGRPTGCEGEDARRTETRRSATNNDDLDLDTLSRQLDSVLTMSRRRKPRRTKPPSKMATTAQEDNDHASVSTRSIATSPMSHGSGYDDSAGETTTPQPASNQPVSERDTSSPGGSSVGDDPIKRGVTSPPNLTPANAKARSAVMSSSDDDDDDNLEDFFQKMNPHPVSKACQRDLPSMENFIVDDDDVSSDENSDLYAASLHRRLVSTAAGKKSSVVEPSTLSSDDDDNVFATPARPAVKRSKALYIKPAAPSSDSDNDAFVTPARHIVRGKAQTVRPPVRPAPGAVSRPERPRSAGHSPERRAFLPSLADGVDSSRRDPQADRYVKGFKKLREQLTAELFKLYNATVFNDKLPGDVSVEWNSRLLKTAGYCQYRRAAGGRSVRLQLSVKVCDSAERTRDTLIHEMCHAMVWVTYGLNDGHGSHWRFWANAANAIHPSLPVIRRCHNYDIAYKYTYSCVNCGYSIGRHSKSLNMAVQFCGYCQGAFELLVGTPKGQTPRGTPRGTPRTPNRFALYVKENYGSVRRAQAGASHRDVMMALGHDFTRNNSVKEGRGDVGGGEG